MKLEKTLSLVMLLHNTYTTHTRVCVCVSLEKLERWRISSLWIGLPEKQAKDTEQIAFNLFTFYDHN